MYALNVGSLCLEYRTSVPRISDLYSLNLGSLLAYCLGMPICSAIMDMGPGPGPKKGAVPAAAG